MYGERLFQGPKKTHYEERLSLFRRCFVRIGLFNKCWYKGSVSFVWTTMKYEVKSTDYLFTTRKVCCEIDIMYWSRNFRHISYKSPRNNSIKPFQFFLREASLLIASSIFFWLGNTKEHYNSYIEAAGDWNGGLDIEYYHDALNWLKTYIASLLW